jgi:hypothetical protein
MGKLEEICDQIEQSFNDYKAKGYITEHEFECYHSPVRHIIDTLNEVKKTHDSLMRHMYAKNYTKVLTHFKNIIWDLAQVKELLYELNQRIGKKIANKEGIDDEEKDKLYTEVESQRLEIICLMAMYAHELIDTITRTWKEMDDNKQKEDSTKIGLMHI